ncbi:MAG TPA: O-antigen ligase family protein [Blastocatellia bacterium]|nr:O-antigen ligase family protein [Blastocatellia bacterium]
MPKFAVLLTGSSALLILLIWTAMRTPEVPDDVRRSLASRHVLLVSLYTAVILISTVFGVAPIASFFGSSYGQMGLLTHLSFFIVFISLICIAGSEKRFRGVLWAMTLTGLAVATYAFVQFFGKDPFVPPRLYIFESDAGAVLRVISTIGHSNYLGNFLLYIAPLGVALALVSRGSARRAATAASVLSVLAIAFSGTRGAWVGLVIAALVLLLLLRPAKTEKVGAPERRQTIWRAVVIALGVLALLAIVSVSPASRSLVLRARSMIHENTGAGRTLLWRDSMKMVRDYAIVGCGPEAFRKVFLAYKSDELARLAPGTNNESSHNSFIDAALSFGLPGAILYVAIIASSLSLLWRARRRARDRGARIITSALVASFVAVVVHNFFIFDQISTGLYFFAFAALAQIASNNGAASDTVKQGQVVARGEVVANGSRSTLSAPKGRLLTVVLLVVGAVVFVMAAWYSTVLVLADIEINKALSSAIAGRYEDLADHCNRATSYPDPAGDYSLLAARCLTGYSDAVVGGAGKTPQSGRSDPADTRKAAISLAMVQAEKSIAHSLTPDAGYILLAYLAFQLGDSDKVLTYSSEAVRLDPRFSNSHWLLAEAYLGKGDRAAATREARLALYLDPQSSAAHAALKRARGAPKSADNTEAMIDYARGLAAEGLFDKARRVMLRAIRKSDGPCPHCHSALALLYEQAGRNADAIVEWEAYEREAPVQALAEKTSMRIERLKREIVQDR